MAENQEVSSDSHKKQSGTISVIEYIVVVVGPPVIGGGACWFGCMLVYMFLSLTPKLVWAVQDMAGFEFIWNQDWLVVYGFYFIPCCAIIIGLGLGALVSVAMIARTRQG